MPRPGELKLVNDDKLRDALIDAGGGPGGTGAYPRTIASSYEKLTGDAFAQDHLAKRLNRLVKAGSVEKVEGEYGGRAYRAVVV